MFKRACYEGQGKALTIQGHLCGWNYAMMYAYVKFHHKKSFHLWETELNILGKHCWRQQHQRRCRRRHSRRQKVTSMSLLLAKAVVTKMSMELQFLFTAHHLYQVLWKYLEWFQSYRADTISILLNIKGYNSVKNVGRVTFLNLCTLSHDALHLF